MYLPPSFKEDRLAILHETIRRAGLGTLVTVGANGPLASHVPMLLSPDPPPHGTLRGHLAKANGQWRGTAAGSSALAIFLGPDAYISPTWYATKRETGKVVPTWNYVAVHASGPVRFFEDEEELLELVSALTERHEAAQPAPWSVDDAPESFIRSQLKGIVGFELQITCLEGKWKMSQNRPAADREGVIAGLRRDGAPEHIAVARIVADVGGHGR